eukprot:TRINITY_DN951_c0_g1_i1.p1 TRINITY_DN951_c0_g1~~TRINITY_DN951_c0_g1_i1.p1  ORF type:complete len:278 (-),score=66.11 TRINITY_DN951_c0_g1_i1:551-1384(-)
MSTGNLAELQAKVQEYESQLKLVDAALLADPENADLNTARNGLKDVIKLTWELLEVELARTSPAATAAAPAETAAALRHVKEEPGAVVEAQLSDDTPWVRGIVQEVTEDGNLFLVQLEDREIAELIPRDRVRFGSSASSNEAAVATDQPPHKGKPGKHPQFGVVVPDHIREIPKSLKIHPADKQADKDAKRRKVHAIKSGNRLKRQEDERRDRQSVWQSFLQKQRKPKDSMFKSPDNPNGKVGVVGSGRPMTDPTGVREKWKFGTQGPADGEEEGDL